MARMTSRLTNLALVLSIALIAGCPAGGGGGGDGGALGLDIERFSFSFRNEFQQAGGASDSFLMVNLGDTAVSWSIEGAATVTWLDLDSSSGSVTGFGTESVRMTVNSSAGDLAEDTYSGSFTVRWSGGSQVISVNLTVTTAGALTVSPLTLDFGTTLTSANITIGNSGSDAVGWRINSITPEGQWLSIAAASRTEGTLTGASATESVEVQVDRTDLSVGDYTGRVTINTVVVEVAMTVALPEPILTVAETTLSFETRDADDAPISISNTGTGTLIWSIVVTTVTDSLPDWIRVSPTSGDTTTELDLATVSVNAVGRLPADDSSLTLTATITVNSVDEAGEILDSHAVAVTLFIPPPTPLLEVSPTSLDLGTLDREGSFTVANVGTGSLTWEASPDASWITILAADEVTGILTGTLSPRDGMFEFVDFAVDRSGLTPPGAEGTITITSADVLDDEVVTVSVEVLPPTLQVVPEVLNFSTNLTRKILVISNKGTGTVNWSIDTAGLADWLSDDSGVSLIRDLENVLPLTSGSVSGDIAAGLNVGVNRNGLRAGNYTERILVRSDDGQERPVDVLMSVADVPVLGIDTGPFARTDSDPLCLSQPNLDTPNVDLDGVYFIPVGLCETATFLIWNEGEGTLNWEIDLGEAPEWLSLDRLGPGAITDDEGALQITVSVNTEDLGLPFGGHTHTFTIRSNDRSNPEQLVRIEMSVEKVVTISTQPSMLDMGSDASSDNFAVSNFGDPDTVLRFGLTVDKPWVFAFPNQGRSLGVDNPALEADWQPISVAIDRTRLDGAGGGTATITIFANNEGGERDDTIAEPQQVTISVQAAELFIESPAPRLRVPSLVRYVMTMRNLRFQPITLSDAELFLFADSFTLFEEEQPLELTETNQFLKSATDLKNRHVILLDYTGSAFASAALAQASHEQFVGDGMAQPDPAFVDAADPLQYIYEAIVESLLDELPESYEIAIMQFHDRDQPAEDSVVRDFTPNDGNLTDTLRGRFALMDALRSLNVTDHGATAMVDALLVATDLLAEENEPAPSETPVAPAVPFDDADIRSVILVSDGRTTSDVSTVEVASLILRRNHVKLSAVAWGENFNAGPMAMIAVNTGGHLYVTESFDSGLVDENDRPIRRPSIAPLLDWFSDDSDPADPGFTSICDLSISEDLQSQAVLGYVTLSSATTVKGRVVASFDDPNDEGDADDPDDCRLTDQGVISGEIEHALEIFKVRGGSLGVNLGQISLSSEGIVSAGGVTTASVYVHVDYMLRDVTSLVLEFSSDPPELMTALVGVGPLPEESGISYSSLDLTGPVPGGDADSLRWTLDLGVDSEGETKTFQYGDFGNLLRLDFTLPDGTQAFTVLMRPVLASSPDRTPFEERLFLHPDGFVVRTSDEIRDNRAYRRAPSFPTPLVSKTLLDYGCTSDLISLEIRNIGGALPEHAIYLTWNLASAGGLQLDDPDLRPLETINDVRIVDLQLKRDGAPGVIRPGDFFAMFAYESGITNVEGTFPFAVAGAILPPVLNVSPLLLDFGDNTVADPIDALSLVISLGLTTLDCDGDGVLDDEDPNDGVADLVQSQGTLDWFIEPADPSAPMPDWIEMPLEGRVKHSNDLHRQRYSVEIDRGLLSEAPDEGAGLRTWAFVVQGRDLLGHDIGQVIVQVMATQN